MTATVGFWTPLCMWPNQVEEPCEHDGEIVLCNLVANYFADGYSYCEKHIKEFVQANIDHAREHLEATEEWNSMDRPDGSIYDYNYEPKTPSQLQDDIDNELNREWSYNGGGDE